MCLNNTHFVFYPCWSARQYTHAIFIFLFSEDLGQHPLDTDSPVRQAQVEGVLELGGIESRVVGTFGWRWKRAGRYGIDLRDSQFNPGSPRFGKHQLGIVKPGRGAGSDQMVDTRHFGSVLCGPDRVIQQLYLLLEEQ